MTESITQEDLVELFAALPDSTRASIKEQLESVISEMTEEAQGGAIPQKEASQSLLRLEIMLEACTKAHGEFKEIMYGNKDSTSRD